MDRVAKQGGRVVFGDEGLAEWLYDCELQKYSCQQQLV